MHYKNQICGPQEMIISKGEKMKTFFLIILSGSFLYGMENGSEELSDSRSHHHRHKRSKSTTIKAELSSMQEYRWIVQEIKDNTESMVQYAIILAAQEADIKSQRKEIDSQAKKIKRLRGKAKKSKEERIRLEEHINILYTLLAQSNMGHEQGNHSWSPQDLMTTLVAASNLSTNN